MTHNADKDAAPCHECGAELGPHDTPPFGPPRHFVCPKHTSTFPAAADGAS